MTTPRTSAAWAFLAASTLLPAARAQVSEYFLMTGDQAKFHVIQGGVLKRSWSPAAGTATYQYPFVVTTTVRSMGADVAGIGAEYDLNGTDLTLRYTHPAGTLKAWDATTDGTHNYVIDDGGSIYLFDAFWNVPVRLFGVSTSGGITYDPANNSLWVSQFSGSTLIVEYSLAGAMLRSFSTGHDKNMALALDHADGTLWLHDRNTFGTYEQWTKTGVRLNRIAVTGMSTQNVFGGEMSFAKVAKCTFRNGTNLNPVDYFCVTRPALGTSWTTSYQQSAKTLGTALVISAGPATGPYLLNGELLISFALPTISVSGTGNLAVPIPNDPALGGALIATQGFRLDNGVFGPQILLLNAQDLMLGY